MMRSRAHRATRAVILGGAILSLSLLPARARADAVPPPPTDCPEGTMGATCHGPQYCTPNTCKTSADCVAGQVCQPRAICLGQVNCYSGLGTPDGGPSTYPEPTGGVACSSAADCDGGATCATQSLCVTPGSTGSGGGSSSGSSSGGTVIHGGCSCEAAGGGAPLALSTMVLVAGGAGALARWRRRRPRR